MYLAAYDRLSPANTSGKWKEMMRLAEQRAGRQSWATLWQFNGCWKELEDAHELLVWMFLFDGVFRVRLDAWWTCKPEVEVTDDRREGFLCLDKTPALLSCPSGEIIVESLVNLGKGLAGPLNRAT
jgi:hypothetical protein